MPAFVQKVIDKIKNNKIVTAVIIGVAVAVDYAFDLGISQTVIDLFATEAVAP